MSETQKYLDHANNCIELAESAKDLPAPVTNVWPQVVNKLGRCTRLIATMHRGFG
jgi:hypothetical protein